MLEIYLSCSDNQTDFHIFGQRAQTSVSNRE
jgi:hypothetical protein